MDVPNQSYEDHRPELYSRHPHRHGPALPSRVFPYGAVDQSIGCTVYLDQRHVCDRTDHRRHIHKLVPFRPACHPCHDTDRRHRAYDCYFYGIYFSQKEAPHAGTEGSYAGGRKSPGRRHGKAYPANSYRNSSHRDSGGSLTVHTLYSPHGTGDRHLFCHIPLDLGFLQCRFRPDGKVRGVFLLYRLAG